MALTGMLLGGTLDLAWWQLSIITWTVLVCVNLAGRLPEAPVVLLTRGATAFRLGVLGGLVFG